jgi:hypothetical protein
MFIFYRLVAPCLCQLSAGTTRRFVMPCVAAYESDALICYALCQPPMNPMRWFAMPCVVAYESDATICYALCCCLWIRCVDLLCLVSHPMNPMRRFAILCVSCLRIRGIRFVAPVRINFIYYNKYLCCAREFNAQKAFTWARGRKFCKYFAPYVQLY